MVSELAAFLLDLRATRLYQWHVGRIIGGSMLVVYNAKVWGTTGAGVKEGLCGELRTPVLNI